MRCLGAGGLLAKTGVPARIANSIIVWISDVPGFPFLRSPPSGSAAAEQKSWQQELVSTLAANNSYLRKTDLVAKLRHSIESP